VLQSFDAHAAEADRGDLCPCSRQGYAGQADGVDSRGANPPGPARRENQWWSRLSGHGIPRGRVWSKTPSKWRMMPGGGLDAPARRWPGASEEEYP